MSESLLTARLPSQTTPNLERRTCERFQPSNEITCHLNSFVGTAPQRALLLDISQGGMGLLVEEPTEPETVLIVSLTNTSGQYTCRELVWVRHVTEQPRGCYHVGCEFIKKLTLGDLHALALITDCAQPARPAAGHGAHLRAWRRCA